MIHCPDPSLLAAVLHVIIIDMHKLLKYNYAYIINGLHVCTRAGTIVHVVCIVAKYTYAAHLMMIVKHVHILNDISKKFSY